LLKYTGQTILLALTAHQTPIVTGSRASWINFLGVTTDSNLSWEVHIERTCSRISRHLFIINRLSKILDMNVRRMLYYGLIYSLLAHGITVSGQGAKTLTRQMFTLQKRLYDMWQG
jgi:hypothetical protein